jgi:cytochrome P450
VTAPAAEQPRYLPGGGEAWRNPWPGYAALRDHDPVHRVVPEGTPHADYYVLSRHADVMAAAVDAATFSSAGGLTVHYDELDRIGLADNPPMVMQDPPVHTEFRRLVSRGFTPRAVVSVEPAVRAFVRQRLDRIVQRGGGDIVAEVFKPLPSMVVAHYLGVPEQDRERFDGWTDAIVAAGAAGDVAGAPEAVAEMLGYFGELVERRRREPGDDTVSHLVAAGVGDDDSGLLSILAYVFTMVTGGNDTTTGMLGGAVQLLTERPDQREALVAEPDLIAPAVEELLRLTSPVQGLARTTTRDVTLHDVTVPAGRKVLLLYGAANRDPRRYGPDADALDVRRRPGQILTFGQGNHFCLGGNAARMQARVALEELLARCPSFDVDVDAIRWAPGPYVRRPTTVPFRVDGRPSRVPSGS